MLARQMVLLLGVTWGNISNYFQIRRILWSIVLLNRKKPKANESIISRVSMYYLLDQIKKCKKDFIVWWKVKRAYAFIEIIIEIVYFILIVFGSNHVRVIKYYTLFMLVQCVLWTMFLRFHLGFNDRLTKYDKMRMKK